MPWDLVLNGGKQYDQICSPWHQSSCKPYSTLRGLPGPSGYLCIQRRVLKLLTKLTFSMKLILCRRKIYMVFDYSQPCPFCHSREFVLIGLRCNRLPPATCLLSHIFFSSHQDTKHCEPWKQILRIVQKFD